MANTIGKNAQGYGYKYTDLAHIHEWLESNGLSYYQYIETVEGVDYVMTVPVVDGEPKEPRRGCRVVQATLSGKSNPAQEQGSALTYARRYSLLMAFGLATEDDDGESLTRKKPEPRTNEPPTEYKRKSDKAITDTQITAIENLLTDASPERLEIFNKCLDYYKVENVQGFSFDAAAAVIKRLRNT